MSSHHENFDAGEEDEYRNLWQRSPSPQEAFENVEDKEWPVMLKSEEVGFNDKIWYEVDWDEWSRPDGTRNTWDDTLIVKEQLRLWKRETTRRRNQLAKKSNDIDIWGSMDVIDTPTRERAQAYSEKLALYERPQSQVPGSSRHAQPGLHRTMPRRKPTVPKTIDRPRDHSPESPDLQFRFSSEFSTTYTAASSSTMVQTPLVSSIKGKEKATSLPLPATTSPRKNRAYVLITSPRKETEPTHVPRSPSRAINQSGSFDLSKRTKLEAKWNELARQAGAAAITICNDQDDEVIPPLPPGFRYLEGHYAFAPGISHSSDDFLESCDCVTPCNPNSCNCTGVHNRLPYNPKGFVTSLAMVGIRSNMVVECNQRCSCSERCLSRVVQSPRTIPVQVFKTAACGWGIRSGTAVKKGQVLGTYTGKVITRVDAERLSPIARSYCYDLDFWEDDNLDDSLIGRYTIDARSYGNWTRFLNHSCDPNLWTFCAAYDTIPESNIYHIAFVAARDIPAGSEFTIDYAPGAIPEDAPPGAPQCHCGAQACRRWYRAHG